MRKIHIIDRLINKHRAKRNESQSLDVEKNETFIDEGEMMKKALEKAAREAILLETKRAAIRSRSMGAQGW